jgi:hypothetical protein
MTPQVIAERDFPKGHPKAADYVPGSPDAVEWARKNIHPKGERDFPVDHPKAVDTAGNTNHVAIRPGIDPLHPELEEFTGATPEVAAARRAAYVAMLPTVEETPMHPEGFVDTVAIATKAALKFLADQGHTAEEAQAILAAQGLDKVLAAKATVGAKD